MAIFSALGSVIGGNKAAKGAKAGGDFARSTWDDIKETVAPWIDEGSKNVAYLGDINQPNGTTENLSAWQQLGMDRIANDENPFDPNAIGETFEASPGYDYQLSEGQAALDASAAAKGGLLSGATVKAGQENAVGLANQDYWNYINQTQQGMQLDASQRQQQFANIFGVSGQGLQAANTYANAGTNIAGTVAQAETAAGAAKGQGIQGAFGAIGKFLNPFGG